MSVKTAALVRKTGRRFGPANNVALKLLATAGLLYIFILSITLLGESFKLFGSGFAETIFRATSNPVVGLMIGLLTTSLIQSSSTTTSIVVGLAASGVIGISEAVPMVMGANIGTSITNTIVSLGHLSRVEEFKRAFAGSVLHDFFNLCSVIVLLPLEMAFGIISRAAIAFEELLRGWGGLKFTSPIKAITKPAAKLILHETGDVGWIGALIALLMLFFALRYIVKILRSLVLSRVERFFQRYIFRTPALGLLLGLFITVIVQSSSVTTSLSVPLLGAGVLSLHQIYPYLLGANVGTTITAFLASFAATGSTAAAVSVAFAHLLFNVYGIVIFWPLQRIPIYLARTLAALTTRSRLVPILYIVTVFFLIPGVILLLTG